METNFFWGVIGKCREASRKKSLRGKGFDQDRFVEHLAHELKALSTEEIITFNNLILEFVKKAYRWDLWDAAYLIKGGCSDDSFHYFRLWLIAQGESVYTAALENPDSLADYIKNPNDECEFEFEDLFRPGDEVWKQKTGKSWEESPQTVGERSDDPVGEHLEEDDPNLSLRFPKLCRKFGF